MAKQYFVRHGQSEYNAGLSEAFNTEVTIKGLEQAAQVALTLDEEIKNPQDYIGYVSPYTRCLQTALVIYHRTGIKFIVTPFLGESPEEVHSAVWKVVHSMRFHFTDGFDWDHYSSYDYSESKEQYKTRLDEMMKLLDGNRVIVSHMTPIADLIRRICFEGKQEPMRISNCSVSLIEDGKPIYIGRN